MGRCLSDSNHPSTYRTASGILIAQGDIMQFCASGLPPSQCVWYAEWFLPSSGTELDALQRGEWYVTLGLTTSPDAIMRGQLEAVPEPSIITLLVLGLL